MRRSVLCGRCPKLHGPYWYAAWKEGGRTRWRYIGSDAAMSRFLAARAGGAAAAPAAPATCARCGRPSAGYCWPSRAWLRKHPRDTGAGAHTPDARRASHAARQG